MSCHARAGVFKLETLLLEQNKIASAQVRLRDWHGVQKRCRTNAI